MMNRLGALLLFVALAGNAANAQTPADPVRSGAESSPAAGSQGGEWQSALSLANVFDGNINHDPRPVRSYGVAPALDVSYVSSKDPAFAFGYEIAANSYTATDEWDRVSHDMFATVRRRVGRRLRLETEGGASWKGSSEDRELANVFGVSQRATYRISETMRVSVTGVWRYKQYDDPGTSGPSPSLGAKIDKRLSGDRRLAVAYKYQTRLSTATRDRYRRNVYSVEWSGPVAAPGDRLSIGFEYRPQQYQRLIKVGGQRVWRVDRRVSSGAEYRRPVSQRVEVRWLCGLEYRDSNDPTKHFLAPTFGMTMTYRLK
jgi:hypothetical protein